MFEIVYFTVATLFAGDIAVTETAGIRAELADNQKAKRIEKKIERLQRRYELTAKRLESSETVLRPQDAERKNKRFAQKMAKYELQLEFTK